MKELIKIDISKIGGKEINSVNARDLWKFLESNRSFNNWITKRIADYRFEDGKDFTTYLFKNASGRPLREYIITIDVAKELAMVENNDMGKEARQYFIDCEKRLLELNQQWQIYRANGKIVRKELIETIQAFIELAKDQGSTAAHYYYHNFTTLIQKSLFHFPSLSKINKNLRDTLDYEQLAFLTTAEVLIKRELEQLIEEKESYKLSYQIVKKKMDEITKLLKQQFPKYLTDNEIKQLLPKKYLKSV